MNNNINVNTQNPQNNFQEQNPSSTTYVQIDQQPSPEAKSNDSFKFFKCCSASLKRFSVIIFIMNIFLAIGLLGAAIVLVVIYLGAGMLSVLALPLFTFFVLLVIIARFISALIYGYAEIVEKNEK